MPKKFYLDDAIDAIREVGRPCTKQDIADQLDVARQTIANHADELEDDARVEHGKVGTAEAYWLKEWAESDEDDADNPPQQDEGDRKGDLADNAVEPSEIGEAETVDLEGPDGAKFGEEHFSAEEADVIREHAIRRGVSFEDALLELAEAGRKAHTGRQSFAEKVASGRTVGYGALSMLTSLGALYGAQTAATTFSLVLSVVVGTLAAVLGAGLITSAALAQIYLERDLLDLFIPSWIPGRAKA